MKRTRLAVIGAGHLGRIHTRLASSIDEIELVAVVDPSAAARDQISAEFDIPTLASHHEIAGDLDAAIVATPTKLHHAVSKELLEKGIHLFIEKPLTSTVAEGQELVSLANDKGVTLQVGHVERFNPAFEAVAPSLGNIKYVEAIRTSGYTFRSTDIGAVLDLMVHDLDIVLSLSKSDVVDVQAIGISLFGGHEDMAQARLQFSNGCVANLTASRCSYVAQRRMQLFTDTGFASIDFGGHTASLIRPHEKLMRRQIDFEKLSADQKQFVRDNLFSEYLPLEEVTVALQNAILEEQYNFIHSIQQGTSPRVTGEDGLRAIQLAQKVLDQIAAHRWTDHSGTSTGPLYTPPPATLPVTPVLPAASDYPQVHRRAG